MEHSEWSRPLKKYSKHKVKRRNEGRIVNVKDWDVKEEGLTLPLLEDVETSEVSLRFRLLSFKERKLRKEIGKMVKPIGLTYKNVQTALKVKDKACLVCGERNVQARIHFSRTMQAWPHRQIRLRWEALTNLYLGMEEILEVRSELRYRLTNNITAPTVPIPLVGRDFAMNYCPNCKIIYPLDWYGASCKCKKKVVLEVYFKGIWQYKTSPRPGRTAWCTKTHKNQDFQYLFYCFVLYDRIVACIPSMYDDI